MKHKVIFLIITIILTLLIAGCGGGHNSTPTIPTLIDYPVLAGIGCDLVNRAFYITSYPGSTLSKVTLYLAANNSGAYTIQLQALDSAFNGTVIGQANGSFSGCDSVHDYKVVTFDFGNVAVTKTNVVAFKMSVTSGNGSVYFAVFLPDSNKFIVQETADSTPPLSTNREGISVAIKVEGQK